MVILSIKKEESVSNAFKRLFYELLDFAESNLSKIDKFEYSIHEARKSFKRLRSLLRIYRAAYDEEMFEELNVLFRDAGRKLSHFRDLDAISECLGKIELKETSNIELIDNLKTQIDGLRFGFDEEQITTEINDVISEIKAARKLLSDLVLNENAGTLVKKGIKRIYDNGRTQYYKSIIDTNDILMHEWRKKVKQLWDVVLIFNSGDKEDSDFAEEVHLLSTLLGDYHDLVLTFDFIAEEKLILDEENFVRIKKILYKRKEKISKKAFKQASIIYKIPTDIFSKEFLKKYYLKKM